MTLSLTEKAAFKAKEIIAKQGKPGETYVRVSVKGGGCAGFSFELFLDETPISDEDVVFENYNVKLVTNQICLTYIDGTEIDYVEELMASGFKFNNPNIKSKCGCGQSFGV